MVELLLRGSSLLLMATDYTSFVELLTLSTLNETLNRPLGKRQNVSQWEINKLHIEEYEQGRNLQQQFPPLVSFQRPSIQAELESAQQNQTTFCSDDVTSSTMGTFVISSHIDDNTSVFNQRLLLDNQQMNQLATNLYPSLLEDDESSTNNILSISCTSQSYKMCFESENLPSDATQCEMSCLKFQASFSENDYGMIDSKLRKFVEEHTQMALQFRESCLFWSNSNYGVSYHQTKPFFVNPFQQWPPMPMANSGYPNVALPQSPVVWYFVPCFVPINWSVLLSFRIAVNLRLTML